MVKKETVDVRMFSWFDDHFYKVRYINEAKVEVEEYFASVTTKLGALDEPFLRRWYGQVGLEEALRVMREAGDRGSRIHWAWQVFNEGGAIIYNPDKAAPYNKEELDELWKYYNGNCVVIKNQDEQLQLSKLQRWIQAVEPKQISCEMIVYDIEEKDAGTLDNLMFIEAGDYMIAGSKPLKFPEGWYIIDLKTGNNVSDKARMQVSRYGRMVEKMPIVRDDKPVVIEGALIIHTSASTRTGIEGLTTIYVPREEMVELNKDYLDIAKVWNRQCQSQKPKIFQLPALIVK